MADMVAERKDGRHGVEHGGLYVGRQSSREGGQHRSQHEIIFVERVGHGGWLIGPKLFRPEAFPTCVSS